jgi:hypothetical protein
VFDRHQLPSISYIFALLSRHEEIDQCFNIYIEIKKNNDAECDKTITASEITYEQGNNTCD